MLHPNGPTGGALRGAGGRVPAAVLLAADADEDGDLAVREILKLAQLVRRRVPGAVVRVAGDLARVPQLRRAAAAVAAEGVELLPGWLVPGSVTASGGRLAARLLRGEGVPRRATNEERGSGGADLESRIEADLVVVHATARPAPGAAALARLLRVPTDDRGYLVDRGASPFEPTATRVAGIYVAGAAAGPRTIAEAIRDGAATAGLVHAALVPGQRRLVEPLAAEIDAALCGACAVCAAACPFGAIEIGDKARVLAVHCRGCGTCAAACPTGAASARHFTREQLAAEISGLLGAEDPE
jgi:heterodisulfide reductase subunit A